MPIFSMYSNFQLKMHIRTVKTVQCKKHLGQNREKSSLWKCIFDNMVLYFECRIDKNALLQAVFLAILPGLHPNILTI